MVKRRTLITLLLVLGMVLPAAAHEVGWILMLPPIIVHNDAPMVSIGAPLSEWLIDKPFDTARECEEYRLKVEEDAMKKLDKMGHRLGAYDRAKPYRYSHARCVPASAVYPQAKEK